MVDPAAIDAVDLYPSDWGTLKRSDFDGAPPLGTPEFDAFLEALRNSKGYSGADLA
jgi:hypothetical protein